MHYVLRVALVLLSGVPVVSSHYAGTPEELAVSAVIRFRHYIMGDSLQFDVCSIYDEVGRPADFPDGLDEQAQSLLGNALDHAPCYESRTAFYQQTRYRFITVDSVPIIDGVPKVFISVSRGHYIYREEYSLLWRDDDMLVISSVQIKDVLIVTRP